MSGRILDDRYQLQDVLGRGGMATVWRAVDLRLDRPVAVKILDLAGQFDPVALERLRREARTVARLDHPNIVAVHDFGAGDHGAYLIMELVEGGSLADLLARGPLPVGQALRIAVQICDALTAAHAAGIVHRDIKPANLLLSASGAAKVCDFGIARLADAATGATLTHSATVVGTSDYMAPEQATGNPTDARTDLYALGCVLYAMLAGAPPFGGETPIAVLQQHLNQAPRPLHAYRADIPPQLEQLIAELLAKNPADRPANAQTVRSRLAQPSRVPAARDSADATAYAPGVASLPTATMPLEPAAVPGPSPTRYLPAQNEPDGLAATRSLLTRIRHGRAAVIAVAVALIGLTTIVLIATHTSGNPSTAGAATHPATGSSPTGSFAITPSPTPAQSSPPTTPAAQIAAIQATVSQLVDTGQLDPDAAKDLRSDLGDLTERHGKHHDKQTGDGLAELRQKLGELRQEGKLSASGYDTLAAELDQLAATLPTDD